MLFFLCFIVHLLKTMKLHRPYLITSHYLRMIPYIYIMISNCTIKYMYQKGSSVLGKKHKDATYK